MPVLYQRNGHLRDPHGNRQLSRGDGDLRATVRIDVPGRNDDRNLHGYGHGRERIDSVATE